MATDAASSAISSAATTAVILVVVAALGFVAAAVAKSRFGETGEFAAKIATACALVVAVGLIVR